MAPAVPKNKRCNSFSAMNDKKACQYDSVGNRLGRQSTVIGLTNQTLAYSANDWMTSDQYDGDGNTTNSSNISYQYDPADELTNVNNGVFIAYDPDANRTFKVSGGVTTYYLVDDENPSGYPQVAEELVDSGMGPTASKTYVYGLSLVSQEEFSSGLPETESYYGYDGHGSVRFLTDTNGVVTDTYTYDAYGNLIGQNGNTPNNYLYCGQQFDPDLGLYYNRARYLNPNTGRFWTMDNYKGDQEDPLSLHKYLYAADDPVNNSDPSGNDYGAFDININSIFNLLVTIAANLSSEGGVVSGFGSGSESDDTSELSAGRPSPPPHVTVISTVPADHMTFTALDGEQFYAPPGTDFRNVYKQGASINDGVSDITAALHYSTIKNHCAQWGSLDYQRNNGHGVNPPGQDNFFYKAYTHASNYAVGVYMEAAGFTLDEIVKYAGGYAAKHSSNAKSADLKKWWGNGYDAAKNGTPNGVSSPVP